MVIIISYNKQTWNEYNDSQTTHKNLANGAIISADRLNHMEDGISNNDINKVTDNKNGTIEVNGSSITPADNSKVLHSTITQLNSADMNSLLQAGYFNIINGKNVFPKGDNYTIYQVIPLSNTNGVQIAFENAVAILGMRAWNLNPGHLSFTDWITFADDSKVVHSTDMRKPASEVAGIGEVNAKQDKIGYTPADDSKVVHSKDMRKPASDVAGIEEVNTKQDKISYTPADDSKVVHDNHDGTIKISGKSFTPAVLDSVIGKNAQPIDTDVDTLAKPGLYYVSGSAPNSPFKTLMMLETKIQYDWNAFRGIQIAYKVMNNSEIAVRCINPNGSLTRVGGTTPWALLSDDSKVAHLSGANNFDTVPTVNNNPLLLASSLPSDLARTGSNQEFTGKNTFDTAPIDKTTGHPYITKDSVPSITKDGVPNIPSDVARTGQTNTFTVAQTFSIAPTIKDASTDKGDNQAATMADLKSVEKSAWRELDFSGTSGVYKGKMNIKIDDTNKTIYLEGAMYFPSGTNAPQGTALIDLSHVVNHITSAHGCLFFLTGVNENANLAGSWGYSASTLGFSNSSITINSNVDYAYGKANYILPYPNPGKSAIYVTYDSLK